MKIYHVLTHSMEPLYPRLINNPSGFSSLNHTTNRFVDNLMKQDSKKKFEHVMVNLSNTIKEEKMQMTHDGGYKQIVLRASTFIRDPLEFSLPLIKFIRSCDDGILHVHGTSSYIYDSISPFLSGKKSIAHYRGGHLTLRAFPILFPKYVLLAPFTFRMPRLLFVQNKTRIEKFHKGYFIPKKKMVHVPNGINLEDFKADKNAINRLKEKYGITENEVNILFVGRLVRGKSIHKLLHVFRKLSEKNSGVRLILAGKNYLGDLNVPANVSILGQLEFKDIVALYHICDILVHPSEYDSFPNVVQEAMACSLPVVATKTEGAKDLVVDGATGYLTDTGNEDELAEKLELLISDRNLGVKMGRESKKRIIEEFDWNLISKRIFSSYELLQSRF